MFKKGGFLGKGGPLDKAMRAVDKGTSAAGRQGSAYTNTGEYAVYDDHMKFTDPVQLRDFLNRYDNPEKIHNLTKQVAGYGDQESFLSFYFGKAMNEAQKLAAAQKVVDVTAWPVQAFLIIADHLKSKEDRGKIGFFLNLVNDRKGEDFKAAKALLDVMQTKALKVDDNSFVLVFPEYETSDGGALIAKEGSSAKFKLSGEGFEVIVEKAVDPQELLKAQIEAARAELALAEATNDALGIANKAAEIATLHLKLIEAPEIIDLASMFQQVFTPIPEGWTDVESTKAAAAKIDYDARFASKNMASGNVPAKETHTIKLKDNAGNEHDVNVSYRIAEGRQCDVEIWTPDAEGMIVGTNVIAYGRLMFDDEGRVMDVHPGLRDITFVWKGVDELSTYAFDFGMYVPGMDGDNSVPLSGDGPASSE